MEQQVGIPTVNKRSLLPLTEQTTVLLRACESIAQAEDYYSQNDFPQAYLEAERSTREIRGTAHRLRKQTTRFDQNIPVPPVSISFETLPAYIDTCGKITSRRVKIGTETRLVGGDMERADEWSRAGWNPFAFYRFAAWDGEMTLTFAMSGLGTMKLDDVSIRTVGP